MATQRAVALVVVLLAIAHSADAQSLTSLQYRLTGVSLEVSPTALTVPRGIATQLNTTAHGLDAGPTGTLVRANLRGPSFPGTIAITTTPGQPILLPAFSQPGAHFLEDIRLDLGEGQNIPATPSTVTINVLDQLLVGAVTSRPLSLEEIRALGIQFDANSFQAFNFTIALTTSSGVVTIDMPVLVPLNPANDQMMVGSQIPGLLIAQLPGLDLPNLGIEPIMLEAIEDLPPGVKLPSIPGIIVIPGNIAYLNQFFSVLLSVSNQAPNGTPLVVRDVQAEIQLPAGADSVVGDILRDPPFVPGEPEFDNPLRIARTAAGRQNIKSVFAAGPDGEVGTADDVNRLAPQKSGTAEFLVEGVRAGGHVIDIEIRGVLEGLPSGPVKVAGRTRGAVVVRDPSFALTFIHPSTVRAGTRYDLLVQIQNTSQVAANLVTVSLDAANLSGVRLLNPAEASQVVNTIPAGASATVTLHLEALRTGSVTASSLELSGETAVVSGRRLAFRTGVSEQGVPLSPDTLILPQIVSLLQEEGGNDDLLFRAIALLGEAHSIATTPRNALPPGIQPISAATVTQRARELTEAALRLELSVREGPSGQAERLPEGLLLTLQDLYFDFHGSGVRDAGWDALYRQSRQARLFGAALADVVERQRATLGLADLLALQRNWGDTESYRADHLTLMTQTAGGSIPVVVELQDSFGRKLGGSFDPEGGLRQIPGADLLNLSSGGASTGQFAVLTQLGSSPYTTTLTALQAGSFDLGIVVPGTDGQLRHVSFRGLNVSQGDTLRATVRPRQAPLVVLERNGVPISASADEITPDTPPRVLGVMQNADPSVDPFGRVVAVLFDEDVELASAQNAGSYSIGSTTVAMVPGPSLVDGNAVQRALAQFGQRIVLVGLRDPVGPFVARRLDISGVRDLEGQIMDPVSARRIFPDPDVGAGGQVTGRILKADGSPVATPEITYLHWAQDPFGGCTERSISVKPGDESGRYGLDFVPRNPCGTAAFRIRARDPSTGEEGELRSGIATNGQRLTLDIVLVGRGTVQGTVRGPDGLPRSNVAITLASETDLSSRSTTTDQNGFYRLRNVPVGAFGLEARGATGSARASGAILTSGSTTTRDITIFGQAEAAVTGQVRLPDGSAAPGLDVFIAASEGTAFLASTRSDEAGTFRFERVASGPYHVRSIDRASGLVGEALVTVTAQHSAANPAFVLVLLAGTGSVSGTVSELVSGFAVPVAGALVAGGLQIVTADAAGRYTIAAVPVGRRVIEAISPLTGARGSREVTILTAGQASQGIDIVLQPLARVTGRVLSPDGQPVANQEVRIVIGEGTGLNGRTFFVRKTQSAADGTYVFDQLEPRSYPLTAVRGNEVANGTALLSPLVLTSVVDLRLMRPTGSVAGRVVDADGLGVVAQVALKARVPNPAGILEFRDVGTTTSNPDTGFSFIGIFPGPFSVTASSFFSPGSAAASGVLSETNPVAGGITLVLASNTGRLRGCVLAPDGSPIGPVLGAGGSPLPLSVFITSVRLRSDLSEDAQNQEPDGIRVDASSGCFVSSIPLPPDFYTIEVIDDRTASPTFGLRGQAAVSVQQGQEATQDVRLLGLGSLSVEVVDQSGNPLRGVTVTIRRTTFPGDLQEVFAAVPTSATPVVFEGVTEGPVSVSATVSNDPTVDVGGRDDLRGFGGHTSAAVVRDGTVPVRVVIDAAGVVIGRFLRTDRVSPVVNAQVELNVAGRPTFFDVSGADGSFRFDGVPTNAFTLNGFDPSTGRRAEGTGQLDTDGQIVTRDLILGPLGRVRGVVLDVTRAEPVAGAEVRLSIEGTLERLVTSGVDGTFVFESVPGGAFAIAAVSASGLSGLARGALQAEGEDIHIEVALEGSGRVEGTVRDAAGAPVAAAQVTLRGPSGAIRTAQAGVSGPDTGRFAFDVVPPGAVSLEARPQGALTPGDGGAASGTLSASGEVLAIDVTFQGTITVGAIVTGAVGGAPIIVTLDSAGRFGGRAFPTSVENGVHLFQGVPRAAFTVSASQNTPVGTTISASVSVFDGEGLPPAGGRFSPDIQLALSAVATVRGFVRLSDGLAVSGAKVMLSAGSFASISLTAGDGGFEFVGVPTGVDLRLDIEGPAGGRATFLGTIDDLAVVRDATGDPITEIIRVLDVEPPRVLSLNPPSGSAAVPTNASIVVTFSEPIDVTSLRACSAANSVGPITIRLLESTGTAPQVNDPSNVCDDSNVVPVAMAISPDGTSATLTLLQPLRSQVQHVLTLSGPTVGSAGTLVGGIRDLAGLALAADVVSQFVTRDAIPPFVTFISPADGAANVARESLVRVTFSEPLDPTTVTASTISVSGPSGLVPGQQDLILGNTVVVFTPATAGGIRQLLASDATYTVSVQGVRDLAGNVQAPPLVSAAFHTVDTIAPSVQSIAGPPGAREGQSIELRALTPDSDVAAVEFFVDGVLQVSATVASAPGEYRGTVTMPNRAIQATARAIDTTGNVGALSTPLGLALLQDQPPSVTIVSPAPGTVVSPGTSVSIATSAQDDVAVTQVKGIVSGAVAETITRTIDPPTSPSAALFDIAVPTDAPGGPLTFAAVATDTKGQSSVAAVGVLTVEDDIDPDVSFSSPAAGTVILAGTTSLSVTVRAVDAGRVAEVSLQVLELAFSQTVAILPLASDVTRTFNVSVPIGFGQSALTLTAGAKDRSGRTAVATRTITVLQSFAVESVAARGQPADLGSASANASQTIRITGQGLASTLVVRFPTADDQGVPGTATAPLFGVNVTGTEGSVVVPMVAVTGAIRLEIGPGVQAPGESTLQIVPTLTAYQVPPGTMSLPGVVLTLSGSGLVEGSTTVSFAGSAGVPATDVTGGGTALTVVVPAGFASGMVRVITGGGSSNDLEIADPSTTAFRVVSVEPVDGATSVPLATAVVLHLSGPVDPASVTPTSVVLSAGGVPVSRVTTVGGSGITLTITPVGPLTVSTTYTVNVSGLADLAGSPVIPFTSSFTTTASPDIAPPQVTAVNPPDGAVGVPLDTTVQVTFNEPVNPSTVTTSTFRLLETPAPSTAIVVNGGFDTDAAGWTIANVDGSGGWFASGGNPGGYFILNHNGGPTDPTISDTVSGLVPGQRYRLSGQFRSEYSSFGDPSALSFGVEVGGTLLGELMRPPEGVWQDFAFEFTASSSSTAVSLSAERNGDDSSYGVDNIALTRLLDSIVVVAGDALSATFTPAALLNATRTYRVEVAGVADPAGNVMTDVFQSSFTTVVVVGADGDGDGFPDDVESEAGSDPLDPASTPISVQPPITEAASAAFSVLNTTNLSDATDPAVFVGEVVSAAFSVLNTTNLNDTTDPAVFVSEAVSAAFSVLNTTNLSDATDPAVFVSEAVSAAFSVLNTTDLGDATDPAVFVSEVISPFFVVANAVGLPLTTESALASPLEAARQTASAAGSPTVAITSPAAGLTVFEGQTIEIAVGVAGGGLVAAELSVNGVPLARDGSLPHVFTFTVPANVTSLTLQASVSNDRGDVGLSQPVTLSVVPDPRTTVIGRLVDAAGTPVANRRVTVTLNGLRAEFFDFDAPLTALPDLSGRVPTRISHVSAVNVRNPDGLFGTDPFGMGMAPDYAARFSGYLRIDEPGEYTFRLGADDGARLVVGGVALVQMPTGPGEFQARSQSIQLPAGLIPIEVTYYQSVGDAELQLLYAPPGGDLHVVPPEKLRATMRELEVQTDAFGQFVVPNVPANVPAIQLSGESGDLSGPVPPEAGGVVNLGELVVR